MRDTDNPSCSHRAKIRGDMLRRELELGRKSKKKEELQIAIQLRSRASSSLVCCRHLPMNTEPAIPAIVVDNDKDLPPVPPTRGTPEPDGSAQYVAAPAFVGGSDGTRTPGHIPPGTPFAPANFQLHQDRPAFDLSGIKSGTLFMPIPNVGVTRDGKHALQSLTEIRPLCVDRPIDDATC